MSTGVGQCVACGDTYDDDTPCRCPEDQVWATMTTRLFTLECQVHAIESGMRDLEALQAERRRLIAEIQEATASQGG